MLVVCAVFLTACTAKTMQVEQSQKEATATVQDVPLAADDSAPSRRFTASEVHKFTSATIYNYGDDTLNVDIGTYSTEIAPGSGITVTYQTYATRTISFSSGQMIHYTVHYD